MSGWLGFLGVVAVVGATVSFGYDKLGEATNHPQWISGMGEHDRLSNGLNYSVDLYTRDGAGRANIWIANTSDYPVRQVAINCKDKDDNDYSVDFMNSHDAGGGDDASGITPLDLPAHSQRTVDVDMDTGNMGVGNTIIGKPASCTATLY